MSALQFDKAFSKAAERPARPKTKRKAPPPITFRASEEERAAILKAAIRNTNRRSLNPIGTRKRQGSEITAIGRRFKG